MRISFSANQYKPYISPDVKICTQLTEETKCVHKIILCFFAFFCVQG